MRLDYLDFDYSDEDSGRGGFDAMATVAAARVPAVLHEIGLVLAWASHAFGPPAADGESGEGDEWDYEVQAFTDESALVVRCEPGEAVLLVSPIASGSVITLTFTLSGSRLFCETLRQEFGLDD